MDNKMRKRKTRALTSLLMNKSLPKSKRSQVTIFIIIGVLIASGIALFFLFRSGIIPGGRGGREINPDSFLKSCLEDKIKETVETISLQGGNMNPVFCKRFKFTDENDFVNISYLCYNQNYYLPCINQEPMLIQHLKDEIENEIQTEVEDCFCALGDSLDKQGYAVDALYNGFEVELMPKKIVIEIDAEMTLTKTEEPLRYENFTIITASRFYELAIVAHEIISQEARPCEILTKFDHIEFMSFYPEFNIDKFTTEDSIIIYTIIYIDTKEKFRFAIRGCVIPPGF